MGMKWFESLVEVSEELEDIIVPEVAEVSVVEVDPVVDTKGTVLLEVTKVVAPAKEVLRVVLHTEVIVHVPVGVTKEVVNEVLSVHDTEVIVLRTDILLAQVKEVHVLHTEVTVPPRWIINHEQAVVTKVVNEVLRVEVTKEVVLNLTDSEAERKHLVEYSVEELLKLPSLDTEETAMSLVPSVQSSMVNEKTAVDTKREATKLLETGIMPEETRNLGKLERKKMCRNLCKMRIRK